MKNLDTSIIFETYNNNVNKCCSFCGNQLTLEDIKSNINDVLKESKSVDCGGYILYHGKNYVCIGTGFYGDSKNEKTGAMIQIATIRSDIDPVEAIKTGKDATVCFNCKLRGMSCYVNVGQSISNIYDTYKAGKYSFICDVDQLKSIDDIETYINTGKWDLFNGKKVRFGSYGDPVKIPFPIVQKIVESSDGHTGYTHQWKESLFSSYKKYFMASCDTTEDYAKAKKLGWNTFRVSPEWKIKLPDEKACEFSLSGKQCIDCLKCSGTSSPKSEDIYVKVHGMAYKVNNFLKMFNEPSVNITLTPEEEKQVNELEAKEKVKKIKPQSVKKEVGTKLPSFKERFGLK